MNRETYYLLEDYMISCMEDSAHDKEHVYRVLFNALEIAKTESNVDYDVLVGACLLHDIGRKEQFENPSLCHARVGSDKAYRFLMEHGFEDDYARRVKDCIVAHRFRSSNPPESIEAKILFDADKLDVTGAIGIARTLIYKGIVSEPLYSMLPSGRVSDGSGDEEPSFLQEYKYKLENVYDNFYTARATEIAAKRQRIAAEFYNCLYGEADEAYERGRHELERRVR